MCWDRYCNEFKEWMFYIYKEEKSMPTPQIVELMYHAFIKGQDIGFNEGCETMEILAKFDVI